MAGYTKKRVNLRDSSKLDPLIFTLFFYPLRGCDGCAIGLPPACVAAPAGERRFAAAKRAGFAFAPPQRRTLPLVFSVEKTAAAKSTLHPSGSPDGNAVRVCEAN
ncbi:MAG: hypothetical protein IJC54_07935 [Clostridia bacterium]|nr:hypothetical protein [Clostridia bacterium]